MSVARIDLLVYSRQVGKRECAVILYIDEGQWKPVSGTSNFDRASVAKGFRWGCQVYRKAVKAVEDGGAAIPIIEFPNDAAAQKTSLADFGRSHRPGKYLIHIRGERSDKWFGPVDLEELFSSESLTIAELSGPTWTPERISERDGLLVVPYKADVPPQTSQTDVNQIREEIEACLNETRLAAIKTAVQWLPQAISLAEPSIWIEPLMQRAEASTDGLPLKLADRLLHSPLFATRFESLRDAICAEAEAQADVFRKEVEALRKEQSTLLQQRLEVTKDALKRISEDEDTLALTAVLGAAFNQSRESQFEPVYLDLKPIERAIDKLGPPADLRPILERIAENVVRSQEPSNQGKTIDLEPIAEAIRSLKLSRDAVESSPRSAEPLPEFPASTVLATVELSEAFENEEQVVATAACLANKAPMFFGLGSVERLEDWSRVVAGGRVLWWPVPANLSDVRGLLDSREIRRWIEIASELYDRAFVLALDGINRAPTEAYLEPLLRLKDINATLPGLGKKWPQNLWVAGTLSSGACVLPTAPGVWERALPIPNTGNLTVRGTFTELNYCEVIEDAKHSMPLDTSPHLGTLPSLPARALGKALGKLRAQEKNLAIHSLAVASCLASASASMPTAFPPDQVKAFAPLFPS